MIKEISYAKINLSLDILGLLPNKYHEVRMVMQTISLSDELTFEKLSEGSGVILKTDSDFLNKELEEGKDNLITKAVKKLEEATGKKIDVLITLKKHIPIAAGMAGGSSNGAATLKGINRLFELGLSNDELKKIAATFGADVPFLIEGGLQLSEGIGEVLTKLPALPKVYVVTCKPDIYVSTKEVYEAYDSENGINHPDVLRMVDGIKEGNLETVFNTMGNVLRDVTVKKHPVITKIEESLINVGAEASMMSGSGPTVFGLFKSYDVASKAFTEMKKEYPFYQTDLSEFVN